jgi:hypothetical protein
MLLMDSLWIPTTPTTSKIIILPLVNEITLFTFYRTGTALFCIKFIVNCSRARGDHVKKQKRLSSSKLHPKNLILSFEIPTFLRLT